MRSIEFVGTTLASVRKFPDLARREAGYQLDRVQHGLDPIEWKPMPSIGKGVREIRVHAFGEYRVIYLVAQHHRIFVLHAFRKKSQKTRLADIRQAQRALKLIRTMLP